MGYDSLDATKLEMGNSHTRKGYVIEEGCGNIVEKNSNSFWFVYLMFNVSNGTRRTPAFHYTVRKFENIICLLGIRKASRKLLHYTILIFNTHRLIMEIIILDS